jgi:hypothetical protein
MVRPVLLVLDLSFFVIKTIDREDKIVLPQIVPPPIGATIP